MTHQPQPQSRHPGQSVFKVSFPSGSGNDFRSRRAHKKSRTGCRNCKTRKIKCDENRQGGCRRCRQNGLICDYLSTQPTISSRLGYRPELRPKTTGLVVENNNRPQPQPRQDHVYPTLSLISLCQPDLPPDFRDVQHESMPAPLAMLHHFTMLTLPTCGSPQGQGVVQSYMMRIAMQTPYLLHALLGVAAAHMAHLLPAEANAVQHSRHRLADAYHWAYALRLLREEISSRGAKTDNMDALLSANMLVTVHQFPLRKQEDKQRGEHHETDDNDDDTAWKRSFVFVEDDVEREGALKWLVVQSGFKHLMSNLEAHLHRSIWLPVLLDSRIESPKEGGDPHKWPQQQQQQQHPRGGMTWESVSQAEGSDKVETLFCQLCDIDDRTLPSQNPYLECLQLVLHMRRMRPITCHHFNKMITFLGRITPGFRKLLLARDTAALLILAYWLYLLTGIRQWWLIDRAETECKAIVMFLRSRLETEPSRVVAELLREPALAIGLEVETTGDRSGCGCI